MNDLISREEAIKAVKFYETFCDPYPRVIEALEDLPSVKPRRGKWIDTNPDEYLDPRMTCDQCGNTETLHKANFCPNCGADMREKKKTLNEIRAEYGLQPINKRGEQT